MYSGFCGAFSPCSFFRACHRYNKLERAQDNGSYIPPDVAEDLLLIEFAMIPGCQKKAEKMVHLAEAAGAAEAVVPVAVLATAAAGGSAAVGTG